MLPPTGPTPPPRTRRRPRQRHLVARDPRLPQGERRASPEEERDVLPDFREHSDQELRDQLGVRWAAFHAEHRGARGVSGDDVDPGEYDAEYS
jgi:hypothetical protein